MHFQKGRRNDFSGGVGNMVKQISVFMQNEIGRLAEATQAISESGVNIRALVVADTETYGVLRFISDNTDKAATALKAAGFTLKITDVVAVEMPDAPGGLSKVLLILKDNGINIGYLYAFFRKSHDNAVVIIRVEDPAAASAALQKAGVKTLASEEVCSF